MEYSPSLLQALRDVGEVQGAMLLGVGDRVVSVDWPILNAENLAGVIERHRVLVESIDDGFELPQVVVLDFEAFRLFVRRQGEWSVIALVSLRANLDALKMACTLILRRAMRAPKSGEAPVSSAPNDGAWRVESTPPKDPRPTPRTGTLRPPPMLQGQGSSVRLPIHATVSTPAPNSVAIPIVETSERASRTSTPGPDSAARTSSAGSVAKTKKKKSDIWG